MYFDPSILWLYYSIISTRTNELVFQLISKLALFSGRVFLRSVGTTALADEGSSPTLALHCTTAMNVSVITLAGTANCTTQLPGYLRP